MSSKLAEFARDRHSGKTPRTKILGPHFLGIGYVITTIILVFWLEVFEVIPTLFQPFNQLFLVNLVLFIYSMINIIGNYYHLLTADTFYKNSEMQNEERDGVFYCQSCKQNSPPRSHHCSVCDRCVLRRDHHCFFAATCVGHTNLRFFLAFNFFVFITSAYVFVINLLYLHHAIGPLLPVSFEAICKVVPLLTLFKVWTGSVTFFYYLVVVVTWLCMIQVIGCVTCFSFQMALLFLGQTTYEWRHNIHIYDKGWRKNFLGICGSRWYLWWLFPFSQSNPIVSKEEDDFLQYVSKTSKYV